MAGMSLCSSQYIASTATICCTCKLEDNIWIVDSGASDHMVFDKGLLHNVKNLANPILITLPNGNKIKVSQFGDLRIGKNLVLHNVLFVPYFQFNLLLVKKLSQQLKCEVVFSENSCVLQRPFLKRPLEIGRFTQGLYILDKEVSQRLTFEGRNDYSCNSTFCLDAELFSFSCGKNIDSVTLWHKRLGHISPRKLSHMSVLKDVKCNKDETVLPCDICPRAKQHRLPFHTSSITTTKPFDLIHVDTWGPYHTKTPHGQRYFLTLVDDYTRCTWTHLMVTKAEALYLIKSFVAMAKTQFNGTVKIIRSDNALELGLSNEALQFFASTGIVHQTSCTQTPQQNGVVERKHRHLLEVSRALLFQSHLPLSYWGECLFTATYLINRIPSVVLQHKTPFELLLGTSQLDHLRTFGCLCYVSTTKQGRDKLQNRAIPCVFVGYPHGKKGYKVMSLDDRTIFVSRDVIFHEDIFPFCHQQQNTTSQTPLFPPSPTYHDISTSYDSLQPTSSTTSLQPSFSSNPPSCESEPPTAHSLTPQEPMRAHKTPSYLKDYVLCS